MTTELVLVRGLPGSGKTTIAKVFAANGHAHFEADMWFEKQRRDFEPFLLTHAHKWCKDQTHSALTLGQSVVVANTFTRLWEMGDYFSMAAELGIPVRVITATGNYGSVHNVPPEKVEQMAARWEPMPC